MFEFWPVQSLLPFSIIKYGVSKILMLALRWGIVAHWAACSYFSCVDPGIFVRGCPGQSDKKSSDVFFCFCFFSLFYRSQMVNFKENYHFSRFQRGSNIFQGGSNFFKGGIQLLIPYRNPYNLWFSRGGPDPLSPPLWIRTCFLALWMLGD